MASKKHHILPKVIQAGRKKSKTAGSAVKGSQKKPAVMRGSQATEAEPVVKYPAAEFMSLSERLWQKAGKWHLVQTAARFGATPWAARWFRRTSLLVLIGTTIFWAYMSARVHQVNADQFIDAYMFESWETFGASIFPGTHSFLMKWPVFVLLALFGASSTVLMVGTIGLSLVTVGVLAYVLYKIEPRPWAHGWLCLALASVLLMIPAEPTPGALLPTNFGMTTTRNIEYIVFLASMYCVLRAPNLKPLVCAGIDPSSVIVCDR